MHQIRFWPGLCPAPRCGSLQHSPQTPSWFKGDPTSKWRGGDGLDLPLLLSSFHSYTFHLAMTQYFRPNLTVRWHTTNIISVGSATFGRLTSMTYTQYIMQHKNYHLYIVTWVANLCVCTYTVSQKKTRHQTLAHNFPKC